MPQPHHESVPLETSEQLHAALTEVTAWEKEQNKLMIWDRLSRLPFKLIDKLMPKIIHDKMGLLLDELGSYIQNGGNYLVAGNKVKNLVASMSRKAGGLEQGPYSVATMDEAALQLINSGRDTATVQGATTGFGGVFTLAADIPAILGLSLKVIQEIGLCYGYDPTDKTERIFTVKVMQFASSDIVGKQAVLQELNLQAGGSGDIMEGANNAVSKIQGWREVITVYRDNFGWKKLMQMIPVAGMVFGAYTNRKALEDVGEAARMLYRKRRILARLAETAEEIG
ncbi:EcsC family protein [Paenibacillus pinihumi]|uniref:EcsC family protein n=1 Tax=Paenibacillus pinihumi TaxID=669462 RepID=UPI000411E7E4|nr:EcsC family protein [Paenibacillus pinihumi]